jgi:hypothetical protein
MSGLSLADMRRIGAQKNAEIAQSKPGKQAGLSGLMGRLPFGRSAKGIDASAPAPSVFPPVQATATASPRLASPVSRLPGVFGSGAVVAAPESAETETPNPRSIAAAHTMPDMPVATTPAALRDMVDASVVEKTLRSNAMRHVGVSAAALGLVGFAATGNPSFAPASAAVGALIGGVVGQRARSLPADKAASVTLKRKQAEPLFAALEAACAIIQLQRPALSVFVDGNARVSAKAKSGSKLSSSQAYEVYIGLPLLFGLSLQQLEALAAHALVAARADLEKPSVSPDAVARLDALQERLAKRPAVLRFTKLQNLQEQGHGATLVWQRSSEARLREADAMTARYAGPRVLVQALLAQALVAAKFVEHHRMDQPLGQAIEQLRRGYPRSELDQALRALAQVHYPSPADAMQGLPVAFLERLKNLDMSCPLPQLPPHDPVVDQLPAKTVALLDRKLVGKAPKAKKTKPAAKASAKANGSAKVKTKTKPGTKSSTAMRKTAVVERDADASHPVASKSKKTLLSRFMRSGKSPHPLNLSVELHNQPLYHADEVYKGDPGTGLEAYQALVDAHPRWALARLRLAEAQMECGLADSVANLMHCAERLPSALPTILNRLQGALAMVSPLDGENLRKIIDQLQMNADQIARERAEIDLDSLTPTTMDAEDVATMNTLFSNTPGLREVWVLAMPCSHMPEVPHHAILGLAPRLPADASQSMALTLAEHAAITGTVAVHIEAGTPTGALGDALATHSSFWRADARH